MTMRTFLISLAFISALGMLPEANAQDIIIQKNESEPDSSFVLVFPGNGAFLLKNGRELISLEQREELPAVQFPESFLVEDAAFTGNGLYVKNGYGVYLCEEQPSLCVAFDTEGFRILPTVDDNLFVYTTGTGQTFLYVFDCASAKVTLMATVPGNVVYAYGSMEESFVVSDHCVYYLSDKKMEKVLDYPDTIVSAAQTESGLLFGTKDAILVMLGNNIVGLLEKFGCKQILSTDGAVYIYKPDGSLVCYKAG